MLAGGAAPRNGGGRCSRPGVRWERAATGDEQRERSAAATNGLPGEPEGAGTRVGYGASVLPVGLALPVGVALAVAVRRGDATGRTSRVGAHRRGGGGLGAGPVGVAFARIGVED